LRDNWGQLTGSSQFFMVCKRICCIFLIFDDSGLKHVIYVGYFLNNREDPVLPVFKHVNILPLIQTFDGESINLFIWMDRFLSLNVVEDLGARQLHHRRKELVE